MRLPASQKVYVLKVLLYREQMEFQTVLVGAGQGDLCSTLGNEIFCRNGIIVIIYVVLTPV